MYIIPCTIIHYRLYHVQLYHITLHSVQLYDTIQILYIIYDTVDDYISMYLRTQWKPIIIIIVGGKMKYFRRSKTSSALILKN